MSEHCAAPGCYPGHEFSQIEEECIRFGCGHKRFQHHRDGACVAEVRANGQEPGTPHCAKFVRTAAELTQEAGK